MIDLNFFKLTCMTLCEIILAVQIMFIIYNDKNYRERDKKAFQVHFCAMFAFVGLTVIAYVTELIKWLF